MSAGEPSDDGFQVATWVHVLGGSIARHKDLWIKLGNWETRLLSEAIADIQVDRPVYVSGLARSGSTILLEMLSEIDGVVTHRYKDYPPIFTPYFWNWFLNRMPDQESKAVERTHRDGIMITPDSPEAFEEVLWMAFFTHIHDVSRSNVLDGRTHQPAFENFYRDHIRKLLAIRNGRRYLSKGNYNVTRLEYLLKIFPDARFIIPIREPSWHIASLMKQHKLLCEGERRSPRALEHMRRVGHYEFGLDRRPVNIGDKASIDEIVRLWNQGEETQGWARYWSQIHRHIADRLDANAQLRAASMVVRLEDMCREPRRIMQAVLDHCGLRETDERLTGLTQRVHAPSYYKPEFSDDELEMIDRVTRSVAERFGYTEPGLRRFRGWLN